MVSTKIFKDITRIPILAGIACFINNPLIGKIPKDCDLLCATEV
ncbi:hypothetical protein JCM19294_2479 [Nonlabens tegetincola]|uniref:Uncharacterized protein n=1 Tax=Nonlabens tegetincola TaxID=323273 RepID=A0A090Q0I4_9FLAO|nr:hypothetical protein JCM19294_2479 [Nonlabens tegetincola]